MVGAAIMAGGEGTRLGGVEKPLLDLQGVPFIDRVIESVESADGLELEAICLSPNVPETRSHLSGAPRAVTTEGNGYHEDLSKLLSSRVEPVVVVPADMPLILPEELEVAAEAHSRLGSAVAVMVTTRFKEGLGFRASNGQLEYSGLNALLPLPRYQEEERILLNRVGTACNVNTPADYGAARELLP